MRIVVAMSGGVDSSVAAGLLARDGHEVIGLRRGWAALRVTVSLAILFAKCGEKISPDPP